MEKEIIINGHRVAHKSGLGEGIKYLMYRLSDQEAKVFFDQAYKFGFAMFEDHQRRNYKLTYKSGSYRLERL